MAMNMQQQHDRRLAVLAAHLAHSQQGPTRSVMPQQTCGIMAVVGREAVGQYLVEGLKILEARGYDSAGMATVDTSGNLTTSKFASKGSTNDSIELLSKELNQHSSSVTGIAHTRWATHGGATDVNAHPHLDQSGRIAVVHNGVIENYAVIKKQLKEKYQINFVSETDSEVIAQLIGLYVKEGKETLEAVRDALHELEGTWGLVVLDRLAPGTLIVAKNGSPMLIGLAKDKTFVSSESVAFGRHSKEFIALEDNEIAVLTPGAHSMELSRIRTMEAQEIQTSPSPFPHWTLKEIMEQPEALSRALNYGGRLMGDDGAKLGGLSANNDALSRIKHLVIAACGTSYYAGLCGAHFMLFLEAFETVQVIDAAELEEFQLPAPHDGGLLVISQSGETKDVHRALCMAQEQGLPCISVVNAVGSLIARTTGCGIYLNAGRENAVASTKAFTSQVTVLCLVALWFSKMHHRDAARAKGRRRVMVESIQRLPMSVGMTCNVQIRQQCKIVAEKLFKNKIEHIFVLGKGSCMPIAMEGALKIKEISYVHAEGYPGGALKHGPFALIEEGTPIIFIILDGIHAPKMKVALEEVSARGAYPITITNIPNIWKSYAKDMGDVILVPSNGLLSNLLAIIPLQFIAYELSCLKGINPDRPRHLAKTVTVD